MEHDEEQMAEIVALAAKLQRARGGMREMRKDVQAWARDHESWAWHECADRVEAIEAEALADLDEGGDDAKAE